MAFKIAELFAELKVKDKGFSSAFKKAKGSLTSFAKKSLPILKKNLLSLTKTFAIVGAAGAGAFLLIANKVGKFSTTLQQTLNLLSEADQAKFGETLRAGVRRLAVETGRDLNDVSKALFDLISAGTGAGDALKQLRIGLKLSVGSAVSAGTAIDALTTVQNSFKLSSDDLASTSDFLFTINKAGKTTIEQLAASIGNVASDAAGAGVSIEDFGAAISTLTFAGIKTEITMTKLKSLFNELGKKGFVKNANDALKKYGITFTATELKTSGLIGTLEKLGKLTRLQRQDLTGNSEALSAINTLLASQSKLQADVNAQLNRAGATQKAFEASSKTLGEQLNRMKARFNDVFIEVGTKLIPIFQKIIPLVESAFKTFAKFTTELIEGKGIIGGTVDVLVSTVQVFKSLVEVITGTTKAIGDFGFSYSENIKKVLEANAFLERNFNRLGKEIDDVKEKFRKSQLVETEEVVSLVSKLKGKDPVIAQRELNKITKERLAILQQQKKVIEETTAFGSGVAIKEDRLSFVTKQIEQIRKVGREKIAELEGAVARKSLEIISSTFKNVFDRAKENFNSNADKFKKVFQDAKDGFSKVMKPIKDTFKTISSFTLARAESERQKRLEALTPENAGKIFEKGLLGVKSEFSPQELLGKISSTIDRLSPKAAFVGLEAFQKNLQLAFLDDKKEKPLKDNTKNIKENTNALKKLNDALDREFQAALDRLMLPLGT